MPTLPTSRLGSFLSPFLLGFFFLGHTVGDFFSVLGLGAHHVITIPTRIVIVFEYLNQSHI